MLHVVNLWSARIVLGPGSVEQERIAREKDPEKAKSKPPLAFWEKGKLDWSQIIPFDESKPGKGVGLEAQRDAEFIARCVPDAADREFLQGGGTESI